MLESGAESESISKMNEAGAVEASAFRFALSRAHSCPVAARTLRGCKLDALGGNVPLFSKRKKADGPEWGSRAQG